MQQRARAPSPGDSDGAGSTITTLRGRAGEAAVEVAFDAASGVDPLDPQQFYSWLVERSAGEPIGRFVYAGAPDRRSALYGLSCVERLLASEADVLCKNADFSSTYEALRDLVTTRPGFRFTALEIVGGADIRPGGARAHLSFQRGRSEFQDPSTVPVDKQKMLGRGDFRTAKEAMAAAAASALVHRAIERWSLPTPEQAKAVLAALHEEFPDGLPPETHWHRGAGAPFTSSFTWGHDHDFGFGHRRSGAMATRHLEILSECLGSGLIEPDLSGKRVLDVGCWTGGDALVLAGLGAEVLAIDEHALSAAAARRLAELVGASIAVEARSLYEEHAGWVGQFDYVYLSGVIYHVTDPMLALRICHAYLRPGGRLIVETKASDQAGSLCEYSGTLEKGWNWFAPTREALGRWLVDAGFSQDAITVDWRPIGRLLACAERGESEHLPETAGFSRPGSWMERDTSGEGSRR